MREGFVRPDFSAPIDLDAQRTLVQPGAKVKGMQFSEPQRAPTSG
jgi:hypothetical protein